MAVNVAHLLSKPVDSVKRPPVKPAGTYRGIISSFKFDESKQQKTPFVRFTINNVQPGEDIDAAALLDDTGTKLDFSKWTPHRDFYLTDDAMYRLKEQLERLGIATAGRTFQETIPETKGLPVQFVVTQRASQDGTAIYNDIGDMIAA